MLSSLLTRSRSPIHARSALLGNQRRHILTLAIETSCDDTCVAVLETKGGAAKLWYQDRITCNNVTYSGIHPTVAIESHTTHLAKMVHRAVKSLPPPEHNSLLLQIHGQEINRLGLNDRSHGFSVGGGSLYFRKPDFISVTRGPGMLGNLATGLNTAKALSVAWSVPLIGVHHMQAHALTPRLESALARWDSGSANVSQASYLRPRIRDPERSTEFPFLTVLVSGGHTLLLHTKGLTEHEILAEASQYAIGDMLDKCARDILPPDAIPVGASNVVYGRLLEDFTFKASSITDGVPQTDYVIKYTPPSTQQELLASYKSPFGWVLTPPLQVRTDEVGPIRTDDKFDFTGLYGQVHAIMLENPDMGVDERQDLAKHVMRLAFEHVASRVCLALSNNPLLASTINEVVVSGGVASNSYLRTILRKLLDRQGHRNILVACPSRTYCRDNAPMIAWAGTEMFLAGYRTDLDVMPLKKWSLEGIVDDTPGWLRHQREISSPNKENALDELEHSDERKMLQDQVETVLSSFAIQRNNGNMKAAAQEGEMTDEPHGLLFPTSPKFESDRADLMSVSQQVLTAFLDENQVRAQRIRNHEMRPRSKLPSFSSFLQSPAEKLGQNQRHTQTDTGAQGRLPAKGIGTSDENATREWFAMNGTPRKARDPTFKRKEMTPERKPWGVQEPQDIMNLPFTKKRSSNSEHQGPLPPLDDKPIAHETLKTLDGFVRRAISARKPQTTVLKAEHNLTNPLVQQVLDSSRKSSAVKEDHLPAEEYKDKTLAPSEHEAAPKVEQESTDSYIRRFLERRFLSAGKRGK